MAPADAPCRLPFAYGLKIPAVPKLAGLNGDEPTPYGLLLVRLTKSSNVPW